MEISTLLIFFSFVQNSEYFMCVRCFLFKLFDPLEAINISYPVYISSTLHVVASGLNRTQVLSQGQHGIIWYYKREVKIYNTIDSRATSYYGWESIHIAQVEAKETSSNANPLGGRVCIPEL